VRILIQTHLNQSYDDVFKGFDLKLFKALKPPLLGLEVSRFDGCKKGDEVHLKIKIGPLSQDWISHITDHGDNESEHYFIDEGQLLPPPLKYWKHRHRIIKTGENSCVIHDDIEFSANNIILDVLMYPVLYFQFWLRKPIYKKYFK
jgi:ligand-binding SRPBCC domain-containing protein